jgi:hypothetical protein
MGHGAKPNRRSAGYVAILATLQVCACGGETDLQLARERKVVKYGEAPERTLPKPAMKILFPHDNARFRKNEIITCEFTVENRTERELPESLTPKIMKKNVTCSGEIPNSASRQKLNDSAFLVKTKIACPGRSGVYQLGVHAVDLWYEEKADGTTGRKPRTIEHQSPPVTLKIGED